MIEYIFVDQGRIDRYAEQITEPVKHGRKVVWSVSLNLLGPKVSASETLTTRDRTNTEKIEQVLRHIRKKKLLSDNRRSLNNEDGEAEFFEETLRAHRCIIPNEGGSIAIWVATDRKLQDDEAYSNLFLIEDFRGIDDDWGRTYSSYSSLNLLIEELTSGEDRLANSFRDVERRSDQARAAFVKDPVGVLTELGAKFGPSRAIKTIYRFRASCADSVAAGNWEFITIGYPIVIWAA